jgi:hypothetical protein
MSFLSHVREVLMKVINANSEAGMFMKVINTNSDLKCIVLMKREIVPRGSEY